MPDDSNQEAERDLETALEESDDEGDVDPEFYRHGGVSLSESEREVLGDLTGRRVLVVQAGTGEDVLSLRNLGADVTVVDDEESLSQVRELAVAAGIEVTFVEDDPGDLAAALRSGAYDVAYSGFAAIEWVPSLSDWASGISGALKAGGKLVVYDEHPFAKVFGEGGESEEHLFVANSYFGEVAEWEDDEATDTAPSDEEDAGPELAEPTWTLGDIVNALGSNGMAVVALREFPESDRFETSLDALVDVDYDEASRIPAVMLMVAIKL
jgi:SAM-dependent methyltransferase